MRAFFILSYPRSRTAWLARALTHGPAVCLHEGLLGVSSVAELRKRMEACGDIVGNSDCANVLFQDALRREFPAARFVAVMRDPADVTSSLEHHGLDTDFMPMVADAMRALPSDVLRVRYEHLSNSVVGAAIWQHCIGDGFDPVRWRELSAQHIERDLTEMRMAVAQSATQTAALFQEASWPG